MDERLARWDGSRVKHLLVWAEQGVGDEVMFSSMLKDIAELVDQVTVAVIIDCCLFLTVFSSTITFVSLRLNSLLL